MLGASKEKAMANIVTELLIVLNHGVKNIKVTKWTKERIEMWIPLIFNIKVTLLAKNVLPAGMFFPLSPEDWIPDHIVVKFCGVKITMLGKDILDYVTKFAKVIG